MKHLKQLMLALPYFDRVPDQSLIEENGERYERLIATRGNDYLLVYNHTGRSMRIRLDKISGQRKNVWWMDAATGALKFIGCFESKVLTFAPVAFPASDGVLIAIDAKCHYIDHLSPVVIPQEVDRNE